MNVSDLKFDKKEDFEEKFKQHMKKSSEFAVPVDEMKAHLEMAMLTRQIMVKNALKDLIEKAPEILNDLKAELLGKKDDLSDAEKIMKEVLEAMKKKKEEDENDDASKE